MANENGISIKLSLEITKPDARRSDLVTALQSVIRTLENTDNWVGLTWEGEPVTGVITGRWEVE